MTDPVPGELENLIGSAMGSLTPIMTQVYDELNDNSKQFLLRDDAKLLFAASAVLYLKPTEVATLIINNGVGTVAAAFYTRFGRPMIEDTQISAFANPSAGGSWAAFLAWAQQLWTTIESSPALTGDINYLAGHVFNHDKGYNRAINFAADATMPPDIAAAMAPPLASSFDTTAVPATNDPEKCGMWIFQAFNKAKLLPTGQAVDWTEFKNQATTNWTDIATALGTAQGVDDVVNDAMKNALDLMGLLS